MYMYQSQMFGIFYLAASSLMFGVRFCAVETVKMELRLASVRRLLCGFLGVVQVHT